MADLTACLDYPALQQLARALWRFGGGRGAAVLVGAGLSRTARLAGGDATLPPLWSDLAQVMAERLYPNEPGRSHGDPLRLAEEFRTYFGQAALDELVRRMIDDAAWSPSQAHRVLLGLPWSDVLTTNYDTLLERAARLSDREYQTVLSEADLAHARAPRIAKLHGSVGTGGSFVIAEEDYRTYPARHAAFVNLARQIFVENELVLIGFSGDDPNFSAWAGWVRDHLGSTARRIYLAGALGLGPARRKFLEARNIAPIDLHELVKHLDPATRHAAAVDMLLSFLAEAAPIPPQRWMPARPPGLEPTIDRDPTKEVARLGAIVDSWHADRSSYPGWLVCPSEVRTSLRYSVDEAPISAPVLALMEPRPAALAVVELCWRHRVSLWPLHPSTVALVERFGDLEAGEFLSLADRLVICSTLVRQFRFDGDKDQFERFAALVERLSPERSDAAAEVAHERALRACLEMRFDEAVELANSIVGDDPFWGVRRAAILAEAGHQADAESLVREALADLRERQRADRRSIWITSRLAWAEMMTRAFSQSRLEFAPWTDRFQATRSDPFAEISALRDRVAERLRSEPLAGRTPAFDPGSYTDHSRTIRFQSWSKIEPSVELDRMLADGGIPPRLESVSLFLPERSDALQLVDDGTLEWHLHLLRLLDASDKSFARHWSRLHVARLPSAILDALLSRLEAAIVYWVERVRGNREPLLLADARLRMSIRALARLAPRLDADHAVRVYRLGLNWLRLFPGPARSDVLAELLRNSWAAVPLSRRPELVPDTLDLPLSHQHVGVDPMQWLFGTSADLAGSDPRRSAWIHVWLDAARQHEELRPSAALRLLHLRRASALTSDEEEAFEQAVWARQDEGQPPMPAGTSILTSFWADLKRPDGLDPIVAVRSRVFAATEEIPDWRLKDIRGAIEAGRIIPDAVQAAELFDRLCGEDPPTVGQDVIAELRANLSGYDHHYRARLVSVTLAVLTPTLAPTDLTKARSDALRAFVARTQAISAMSALARWPHGADFHEEIATAARRGLRSSSSEGVADSVDVLLRWQAFIAGKEPPIEMLRLIEAVVSAIEYRRSHAVWHLLRASSRLTEAGLMTLNQKERLAVALVELLPEWNYVTVQPDSEEAGVVSLVRAECIRLAGALADAGFSTPGIEVWKEQAQCDPLPEVRFAEDAA